MLDPSQAKEFALTHSLTIEDSGEWLFVCVFDCAEQFGCDVRSGGADAVGGGGEAKRGVD